MVTLIGTGSHSRDIQAIAARRGQQLRVVEGDDFDAYCNDLILVGINDPRTRRLVAQRWGGWAMPLIDPSAICGPCVDIGFGCVVAPNAVLLRDVSLDGHVHINYGTTMTRCSVGAFTTIAPGVTICGDVEIGEAVFIGAGATICNLLKIGDGATIAAGAVVIHDVPAGETVRGVPAT
jgi:sugar O-acyltransferase (sialic acid O-acetyltransferase NeuD family)